MSVANFLWLMRLSSVKPASDPVEIRMASVLRAILSLDPRDPLILSTRYRWRQWQCESSLRMPPQRRDALHLRVLGSAPLALNIMGMCFLSNSVKHPVGHASDGLHSHASLGCSSFLCAVYPVAAIIRFARPASKSAASFSSSGLPPPSSMYQPFFRKRFLSCQ